MKRVVRKTKGLVKGVPSAVLLSALIHTVLLSVVGGVVVFKIVTKDVAKFVPPPPVERPKMDLKRPQVKIRKAVRPASPQRIAAARVRSAQDIPLPEMTGAGQGLGGDLGGFKLMPDMNEINLFGSKRSVAIGNDLEGTLYSMELDRRGKPIEMSDEKFIEVLRNFCRSGWNPMAFSMYYHSPRKLYATQVMIPPVSSERGPEYFGVGEIVPPTHWCVYYKGKIARKEGGRFRFTGMGDDILIVRLNGKVVLNASFDGPVGKKQAIVDMRNSSRENGKYLLGHSLMSIGEWFDLKPGVPEELEILIGEIPGGVYAAMLLVQDADEKYDTKEDGGPILPVFRTAEMPERIRRQIEYVLIPDDADLDGGPLFNVY